MTGCTSQIITCALSSSSEVILLPSLGESECTGRCIKYLLQYTPSSAIKPTLDTSTTLIVVFSLPQTEQQVTEGAADLG